MNVRALSVATAALLAVACGSDKKSSTGGPPAALPTHTATHAVAYSAPTTPVAITSVDDAVNVAGSTMSTVESTSGGVGNFSGVLPLDVTPSRVTIQDAFRVASRLLGKVEPARALGVAVQDGGNCSIRGSGSISGDVKDTANPGANAGDWADFVFNACEDSPGEIMDGVMRLEILATNGANSMDATPAAMPAGTYSARITFANFSILDANGGWTGMNGDVTMTLTKDATSITRALSGTGLVYVVYQGTTLLEGTKMDGPAGGNGYRQQRVEVFANGFSTYFTQTRETLNSKVCSVEMAGCVQVVTNSEIIDDTGANHPKAGSFTITAGNATIRLDILSATNVDVTYDLDTTAPPAATTAHQTWACLDANTCTW